jgi:small subunit ribosomal protein S2
LEKTALCLEGALAFVAVLAKERKTILFVSSKAEAKGPLQRVAEKLNQPYVAGRWIGGTLTNFSEIRKRLSRLAELQEMREKGELAKFTKHERLLIDREIADLELMFGGIKDMQKNPDALFVVDPRKESGAVAEARQLRLPVVALMNSDCDKTLITYPIPGNDASREAIALVLKEVEETYEANLGAFPAAPATSAIPQV